jgi:hypothetical protein
LFSVNSVPSAAWHRACSPGLADIGHKEETTMQANLNENLINGVYGSGLGAFFFAEYDSDASVIKPSGPEPVPDPPDYTGGS